MRHTDTILVIEDDVAIAELLVDVLAEEGYRVQTASNSSMAFAYISNHTPALLLLDMHIPTMNAAVLLGRLRAAEMLTMPVVLMTAGRLDEALLVAEANEVVMKPFDLNSLVACVARHMPQPFLAAAERAA